jgi:predicted esterase
MVALRTVDAIANPTHVENPFLLQKIPGLQAASKKPPRLREVFGFMPSSSKGAVKILPSAELRWRRPSPSWRGHCSFVVGMMCLASLRGHGAWGVAYPPMDADTPKPAVMFLHGMWASPEDSCAAFQGAATPFAFLVCPRGNAPLGDGRMWSGTYATVAPNVHAALDAAGLLAPGKLDRTGGTLMGFSNGAYFAAEVAQAEPGRWTGLVLLSMRLELDVARLRAAGIRRVVLGAGDKDGARDSMQRLAARTDAAGLPARFISLGPVGHEFPPDMGARMCDAIAWVREASPDACRATAPGE